MEHARIRSRLGERPPVFLGPAQRRFVVRHSPLGYRVLVHHPYGRIERLRAEHGGTDFADLDAVARCLARQGHAGFDPGAQRRVRRLLRGPGPRWELSAGQLRMAVTSAA